jgi:hypothetical protein
MRIKEKLGHVLGILDCGIICVSLRVAIDNKDEID